jgi:hypothetical protein
MAGRVYITAMKNTDTDLTIKTDIAKWLGISVEQLEARIALHKEVTRIAAVEALRAEFPVWAAANLR